MGARQVQAAGILVLLAASVGLLCNPEPTAKKGDLRGDARGAKAPGALLRAQGGSEATAGGAGLATRDDALPDAERPATGPVRVKVVGPDGSGLPSVHVALVATETVGANRAHAAAPADGVVLETDEGGEAVFASAPYDGSRTALVWPQPPTANDQRQALLPPAPGHPPFARVLGSEVVYRAGVGLWLEVRVVEADTGRPLRHAAASLGEARAVATSPSGDPRYLILLDAERAVSVPLSIEPPPRRVAWESSKFGVRISPYATRLLAVYPLRQEVLFSVSVLEPDGALVDAPVIRRLTVAGRLVARPVLQTDAYGRLRIADVPFLPGEFVEVTARRGKGYTLGSARGRIPEAPERGLHLEVVVPPEDPRAIGLGGGVGGSFRGRGGSRTLLVGGGHIRPRGSATVDVRRRDGSPAAGAKVKLGNRTARADAQGMARFEHLAPGTHAVTVRQLGLLPLTGSVTVRGEEAARLVLREGRGGRLVVQVVDADDQPLSFATLAVEPGSGHPWVDCQEGVQRIDPFVDSAGRRTLQGIEPGPVLLKATWGARHGQVSVTVGEGEAQPVRLVLKRGGD